MIKQLVALLIVSLLAGHVAGRLGGMDRVDAQAPRTPEPKAIPPVPNPPLYPDSPTTATHWSADEIARIFAARLAQQKGQTQAGAPTFRGQSSRTHSVAATFRAKYPTPRPSNRAGVMSRVDDADHHEGVTDFYVILGGAGQMITGGQIQNRVYGHSPRSAYANKAKVAEVYPGEFNGQPVVNGQIQNVQAGDWLAIPPNVAHWPGYEPGEGLMYLNLKINLGYYPPNLMY